MDGPKVGAPGESGDTELDTDWMHPWIGLDWIGLGRMLEKLGWIGLDCGEWMM